MSIERSLMLYASVMVRPKPLGMATESADLSNNPKTALGCSAKILTILALKNAYTLGFSSRARYGRTVLIEMPTMRASFPSGYNHFVVSSTRQTMRWGNRLCMRFTWAGIAVLRTRHVAACCIREPVGNLHQTHSQASLVPSIWD